MALASVILVKISFITPFNSVNFHLKGAGKNSHRFVIVGSWPSYSSTSIPIGFEPKALWYTTKARSKAKSAMYLYPPLLLQKV